MQSAIKVLDVIADGPFRHTDHARQVWLKLGPVAVGLHRIFVPEQLKVFVFKDNYAVNFYAKNDFLETGELEKSHSVIMIKEL